MNWHLYTFVPFVPCTLYFTVNRFCVIVFCYYGWPSKMGFMPFWQPSTLCFDAVRFHSCIVVSWRINLLSLVNGRCYEVQICCTDFLSGLRNSPCHVEFKRSNAKVMKVTRLSERARSVCSPEVAQSHQTWLKFSRLLCVKVSFGVTVHIWLCRATFTLSVSS